jgi:hypothetical protein
MLEETIVYERLKKAKLLYDSVAWISAFTPAFRTMVLDWIRQDQLTEKGEDAEGDIIGTYSRATELMSDGRKKEGDNFNLNDTGQFYQSMSATPVLDGLIIDGATEKMEDSFSQTNGYWWNEEILGLNEENLQKLSYEVAQSYIRYARKVLQLD